MGGLKNGDGGSGSCRDGDEIESTWATSVVASPPASTQEAGRGRECTRKKNDTSSPLVEHRGPASLRTEGLVALESEKSNHGIALWAPAAAITGAAFWSEGGGVASARLHNLSLAARTAWGVVSEYQRPCCD